VATVVFASALLIIIHIIIHARSRRKRRVNHKMEVGEMTALNGSVGGSDDPRESYGVLGTAVPLVFRSQDGPQPVASVGVEGIVADSDDAIAIYDEVHFGNAESQPVAAGVLGVQLAPVVSGEVVQINSYGFLGGRSPFAGELTGAFGQASERGVIGIASAPDGIGVYGGSVGGAATGVIGETNAKVGVLGRSTSASGTGVQGENTGGGLAGRFLGDVEVTGQVRGNLNVTGDVRLVGFDVAEEFELDGIADAEPGTVMVFEDDRRVRPSSVAYDRRVAGVVSGAGPWRPGLVLHQPATAPTAALALVGRAYCKVSASAGPIAFGDLLTTSDTPGHAMRAADPVRAFGSVIGKALAPLGDGYGLIPILVATR
jgi:hypothetical protein